MTHRKRCWWWTALVGAVVLTIVIPVSYFRTASWQVENTTVHVSASIQHGVVRILIGKSNLVFTNNPAPWYGRGEYGRPSYDSRGLVLLPGLGLLRNRLLRLSLPLYLPLLALVAVLVVPYLSPVVKRRRRRSGLCVGCAYDLTGNESGVCPECGTEVAEPRSGDRSVARGVNRG